MMIGRLNSNQNTKTQPLQKCRGFLLDRLVILLFLLKNYLL